MVSAHYAACFDQVMVARNQCLYNANFVRSLVVGSVASGSQSSMRESLPQTGSVLAKVEEQGLVPIFPCLEGRRLNFAHDKPTQAAVYPGIFAVVCVNVRQLREYNLNATQRHQLWRL